MNQNQSIEVKGAKTPAGTARAEAPGPREAREKAEAVPAESVAPVTEIDDFLVCIVNQIWVCLQSEGQYCRGTGIWYNEARADINPFQTFRQLFHYFDIFHDVFLKGTGGVL